jgi:hypothetical protein
MSASAFPRPTPPPAGPPPALAAPSPPRSLLQKTATRRTHHGKEPPAPATPPRKALAEGCVRKAPRNAKVVYNEAKRNGKRCPNHPDKNFRQCPICCSTANAAHSVSAASRHTVAQRLAFCELIGVSGAR